MDAETQFILNTFSFLVWGALVMWMCAGFTMLEAGAVRTKNASVICLKNIGLYSIAGLTFYLVGYNIMFTGVEGSTVPIVYICAWQAAPLQPAQWISSSTAAAAEMGSPLPPNPSGTRMERYPASVSAATNSVR